MRVDLYIAGMGKSCLLIINFNKIPFVLVSNLFLCVLFYTKLYVFSLWISRFSVIHMLLQGFFCHNWVKSHIPSQNTITLRKTLSCYWLPICRYCDRHVKLDRRAELSRIAMEGFCLFAHSCIIRNFKYWTSGIHICVSDDIQKKTSVTFTSKAAIIVNMYIHIVHFHNFNINSSIIHFK